MERASARQGVKRKEGKEITRGSCQTKQLCQYPCCIGVSLRPANAPTGGIVRARRPQRSVDATRSGAKAKQKASGAVCKT